MKITFTDTIGISDEFCISPAIKEIPQWYKETDSYIGGKLVVDDHGNNNGTIKRCLPVFDSMTAGYIIKTYVDIYVSQENGAPYYRWPSMSPISFHPVEQAPNYPSKNNFPYPKMISPWAIKTEKGYSCLFISPMHNPNKYLTILPGIVDTDIYTGPVSFPFILNDLDWSGIIPAGTPIVQVIPFKRDSFKMNFGGQKDIVESQKNFIKIRSRIINSYKRYFWSKKEYK